MRRLLIWDLVSISRCLLKIILRVSSSKSGKAFCLERRRAACIIIMSEGGTRGTCGPTSTKWIKKAKEGKMAGKKSLMDGIGPPG